MSRATVKIGSTGSDVVIVQICLSARPIDGDFGELTEDAVMAFQIAEKLQPDGIVGPATWDALERVYQLPPPREVPILPPFSRAMTEEICAIAEESEIATYSWEERGDAPPGYIKGMAIAFGRVYCKLVAHDPSAREMARAATGHDADTDALDVYGEELQSFDWDTSQPGDDTLRYLFAFMLGLGMRESAGVYCEGRDMSATNVQSDTCEAGLFQMSWNAHNCSDQMAKLMEQYDGAGASCALAVFKEDVSCSDSSWSCYGSGDGLKYQQMAKSCPQFAVETAALGLRSLCQHWGPINRHEVELREDAEAMFAAVQDYLESKSDDRLART
jgi:hypothetical protein